MSADELNLLTMAGLLDVVYGTESERGDSQLSARSMERSAGVVGARLDDEPPQLANTERVSAQSNAAG